MARGLDYYTGIIYECITEGSAPPGFAEASATPAAPPAPANGISSKSAAKADDEVDESQIGVGSIAAGGRYDNLVGMFAGGGERNKIPCVGISFGVERIFSILQAKAAKERGDNKLKMKEVDVFVMAIGADLFEERLSIADELWRAGIKVRLPDDFAY